MGRYYYGDIEGKVWFGVQSSAAPSRFGGTEIEPSTINYYFDNEDIEGVEKEIEKIQKSLGEKLAVLDEFFDKTNGYTQKDIEDRNISNDELAEYADLCLGIKIRDCIKEKGECNIEAEF